MDESFLKTETRTILPHDHWYQLMTDSYERMYPVESPQSKIADLLLNALGINYGHASHFDRVNPLDSKILSQHIDNIPGITIHPRSNIPVISTDVRDFYPNGLPDEITEIMDPNTVGYINREYETLRSARENNSPSIKLDLPIYYHRLPNGIDIILRGYMHSEKWQGLFGKELKNTAEHIKYMVIEGYPEVPFEKKITAYWKEDNTTYGSLIHNAIHKNPNISFFMFDQRAFLDGSETQFWAESHNVFLKNYYEYLYKINRRLYNTIKTENRLGKILKKMSVAGSLLFRTEDRVNSRSIHYSNNTGLHPNKLTYADNPTMLQFGASVFSEALISLKIHFLSVLIERKVMEKGLIVEYQGADHLPNKSFFMKYPHFALMVVLQNLPYLVLNYIYKSNKLLEEIQNPNWEEILRQIGRMPMGKVDPPDVWRKQVDISKIGRQRKLKMENPELNIFDLLNIDIEELSQKIKGIFSS